MTKAPTIDPVESEMVPRGVANRQHGNTSGIDGAFVVCVQPDFLLVCVLSQTSRRPCRLIYALGVGFYVGGQPAQ